MKYINISTEYLLIMKDKFYDDILDTLIRRYENYGMKILKAYGVSKIGTTYVDEDELKSVYLIAIKTAYDKYQFNESIPFVAFLTKILKNKGSSLILRKNPDYLDNSLSIEKEDVNEINLPNDLFENDPKDFYEKVEFHEIIDSLINSDLKVGKFSFAEALNIVLSLNVGDFREKYPEYSTKVYYRVTNKVREIILGQYQKTKS